MKLSVVIVNYNVSYFLEQCLKSVEKAVLCLNQKYGQNSAEVFVVDNHSVDGSNEMVERLFPWVTLIKNEENVGFSKANNQAMRIASGEYVLLLNPDTVVEDQTFLKVIEFMDAHLDGGGLGVKMLDGKGKFLPESKRGLPTPWVAFYKIFGLSALFPKSRRFGKYHLGFLDNDQIHSIEILSGAFMLMRKSVLDKIGLLDEDFFMYGEDIDLSYRIILAGYKNYYYPETRIIHYKGESTKKSSINYVFIFYKAMAIFAKKHFQQTNAFIFSFLIHLAIYLRAFLSIGKRVIQRITFPILDGTLIYFSMLMLVSYWEHNHKYIEGGSYPEIFRWAVVPSYVLLWVLSLLVTGGYRKPVKPGKVFRGVAIGTMIILVIYGLLPEAYRFSRALILLGAALSSLLFLVTRITWHFIKYRSFSFDQGKKKRSVIVGSEEECLRVEGLIRSTRIGTDIIGFIGNESVHQLHQRMLGSISQLTDLVHIYRIDEVIFCAKDISSSQIIDQMSLMQTHETEFKIAPVESEFIIGSNSIHRMGELYVLDVNAIHKPSHQRNKRFIDILISVLLITVSPIICWFYKQPRHFINNIFSVLSGTKTWVSYADVEGQTLPFLRKGVLTPADVSKNDITDNTTLHHLNMLYAKDYHPMLDVSIIVKNFKKLDRNE